MIETGRLRLREWRDGDARIFEAHTNTPAVMRWLGGIQPSAYYDNLVARMQALQAERGHSFWVVELRADETPLGFCGLKIVDAPGATVPGEVEIGWRFREDAWGKGYAKEAAQASLATAFGPVGAPRVVAFTCDGNRASWGLMERLGMIRRPDLDFDDPRYGADLNPTIVYVLESDQWKM